MSKYSTSLKNQTHFSNRNNTNMDNLFSQINYSLKNRHRVSIDKPESGSIAAFPQSTSLIILCLD